MDEHGNSTSADLVVYKLCDFNSGVKVNLIFEIIPFILWYDHTKLCYKYKFYLEMWQRLQTKDNEDIASNGSRKTGDNQGT